MSTDEIHEVFNIISEDQTDECDRLYFTSEDMFRIFDELNIQASNFEVREMVRMLDLDGSGRIYYKQFL